MSTLSTTRFIACDPRVSLIVFAQLKIMVKFKMSEKSGFLCFNYRLIVVDFH